AVVLGVAPSTVSRLDERRLDPARKEGELAVLFVRLFRSLDALLGGDTAKARQWMHAPNAHLGGVPAERVQSVGGLVDAIEYLDAMRGRSNLRALSGRAWRVVESQHLFATRKLGDSAEGQAVLEELIEEAKPPAGATRGLHWLLFTPFRYPPLRHGSRFGTRRERGIWYGSRGQSTAFAEKAYYLLLFLEGTAADLTPWESD